MDWELYSLDRRNINYADLGENETIIATIKNQSNISDNLKIGDKIYHVGMLDIQKHHVGVHGINFVDNDDVQETLDEEFTCPYCGYIDQDAFEMEDEGKCKCPHCSSELEYSRIVTIEYNVVPVRRAEIILKNGL